MVYPRISVITPSFNQAGFLEQTIKSVIDQNYPNLEHLILDGGSTDGSRALIKKYAAKYPKIIRWRSHHDKGQVTAINEGLKKATGDIIAYLNSDDYYLPDAFYHVAVYFSRHPDRYWLVGNCRVSDPKLSWTFFLKQLWPIHIFPWALYIYNTVNQPAVFLTRSLVERVGKFDSRYHYAFDYDYWLRCQKLGLPGRVMQELSVFRIHPGSKGSSGYTQQFQEDETVVRSYTRNKIVLAVHSLATRIITLPGYRFLKTATKPGIF
nr:MAG: hypothetical protein A2V48_00335 [Candidatus Amesbacteria bacterium RBG_19FT_COMBO_48_16]